MRSFQILLNNITTINLSMFNYLFTISRQVNSLSLRQSLRFNYISKFSMRIRLFNFNLMISEVSRLLRHQPSFRKEIILFRKDSLHLHQISCHMIFPCNHINPRILIDFLIGVHFTQKIRCNREIMPRKIPLRR